MGQALRGESHDYTSVPLNRAVLLLAVPMVLEMVMESLFAITDVFWVSRLGKEAIAVVGITETVMTLIYSIAIGISFAATAIVARRIGEGEPGLFMHGPTFMGNPIACAAANASMQLFDTQPRLQQVQRIESRLNDSLSDLRSKNAVVDVRTKGAVGVVQLDHEVDVDAAIAFFVEQGVWIRPLRDTVYLAPSFTIQPDDLRALGDAVAQYVDQVA